MGIHARPAAMIVRIANRYRADLYVEKDDEVVDGKSIMGLGDVGRWKWIGFTFHRRGRRC